MKDSVLSIDLGSTYTKIAYRKGGAGRRVAQMVEVDRELLVPTMAVRSRRGTRERWLLGNDAANLRPERSDRVFVNWKAGLFAKQGRDSLDAGAWDVPSRFFHWLKKGLKSAGLNPDKMNVKVSIPAFDNRHQKTIRRDLTEVMTEGGWRRSSIVAIEEPLANLMGVATGGVSYGVNGSLDYGEMMPSGSPFIRAARDSVLFDRDSPMIIALVDIGSYTTDVSFVVFEPDKPDGYFALPGSSSQVSHECGVLCDLEGPLFDAFHPEVARRIRRLSFGERELLKEHLFSSAEDPFYYEIDGEEHEIGSSSDRELVARHVRRFANKIIRKIKGSFNVHSPTHICFTGGGSSIEELPSLIRDGLVRGGREIWPADDRHDLRRVGTAVGGTSVILELPLRRWERTAARRTRPESSPARPMLRDCSCGGNPSCFRCFGSGIIR